jgi:hypothetical protein
MRDESLSELLLLPCLKAGIRMEAREDPPEQAEAGLLAPAIGIATACPQTDGLSGAAQQSQQNIDKEEVDHEPLHEPRLVLVI